MPNKSFNAGGYRTTGQYRLVSTFFGRDFQQLVEHVDGSKTWHRQPNGHGIEVEPWEDRRYRVINGFWGARMETLTERADGTVAWVHAPFEPLRTS